MARIFRLLLSAGLFASLLGTAGPLPAGVFDQLERLTAMPTATGQAEFLHPDEAFRLSEQVNAAGELELIWTIEPGYYLYRDKIRVTPLSDGSALGEVHLPAGESKHDPEFGRVDIFRDRVAVTVPVLQRNSAATLLETEVAYQGCAEDGICYPPIKKTVGFNFVGQASAATVAAAVAAPARASTALDLSASDRIARDLGERSLPATLLTFLGLGLLLALTPCVFPMVPILSGIIVGQRQPLSSARAFGLSTVYVLAMALTYSVAGVIAGLAGHNLQATFQHPFVIVAFAAVFVALALSMFGFYALQLPAALQARIDRLSRRQSSGRMGGVAVMGVLSAIIVGPCVAPPLAGALAYIGQTGSPLVGGGALFALGLGMGLPLIAVGTSAGALLPRAGSWMVTIKQVFGVIFLGVAVWFLERVLPAPLILGLWAALAIGSAVFLGALSRAESASNRERLAQALGVLLLIYGSLLLIGAAAGARDPFAPLAPLVGDAGDTDVALRFAAIKSSADLERHMAGAADRTVMVDFYADWCIECKHLERETFTAAAVRTRLENVLLLRADVTANDAIDRELLARYELFGPPAILFFRGGRELRRERLVGFADAASFSARLDRVVALP